MEKNMKILITAVVSVLLTGTSANAGSQGMLKLGSTLHDITGKECLEVLMEGVHLGSGSTEDGGKSVTWKILYQEFAYGVVNRGGSIVCTTKRDIELYDITY
jgi:uncharacterized cupredoxin-like copper-binding protein